MRTLIGKSSGAVELPTDIRKTLDQISEQLQRDPRLQSRHTRRAYLNDLRTFERWRDGRALTKLLVEEYAAQLQKLERSPNSINRALAAVRWWARRLSDLAFESPMSRDQRDEIVTQAARVAGIEDVTGHRQQKGRHIGTEEFQSLLKACLADRSPAGARDAAILAVAWSTGMRRSEIAGLRLDDWKRHLNGQPLEVKGKGNKRRYAYLNKNAEGWVRNWLRLRGADEGPIFIRIRKGGKLQRRTGITDEALAQILAKRSLEAGLADAMTWHDFRRTFAGNLLDSGVDLSTVQKLLGHSSPATTSNYDRRGEAVKQKAIKTINIPFWPEE
jgi:site-specific recombinase XerD